jgi:LPXTG-motif cell wall-anchored protein
VRIFLLVAVIGGAALPALAEDAVTSDALISGAASFDGKEVVFIGEAIGDVMARGDHAWVNLSDGANALGVWLPLSLLPRITFLGSYRAKGDTLRVRGVFHRSCPDHGGDMDIHAREVETAATGAPVEHSVHPASLALAGALLAAAGLAFFLWRRREKTLQRDSGDSGAI